MNRKLIIAAIAASTLAVGGTTAAVAGGADTSAPSTVSQSRDDDRDDGRDDGRDDDRDDRRDDDRDDARDDDRDDARDVSRADVTAREAIDKALTSVNGTVESVELEEEHGSLVWEADVLGKDKKWHEVSVDAHSGKVVADDRGDD